MRVLAFLAIVLSVNFFIKSCDADIVNSVSVVNSHLGIKVKYMIANGSSAKCKNGVIKIGKGIAKKPKGFAEAVILREAAICYFNKKYTPHTILAVQDYHAYNYYRYELEDSIKYIKNKIVVLKVLMKNADIHLFTLDMTLKECELKAKSIEMQPKVLEASCSVH